MFLLKLAAIEQQLKWFAWALGLFSTISIVQNWQLAAMLFGLPFCLIWVLSAQATSQGPDPEPESGTQKRLDAMPGKAYL